MSNTIPNAATETAAPYSEAALTSKLHLQPSGLRTIAYYRVSTARQGASGLGLEAQQETVQRHLGDVEPIATYTEVESGRRSDRPELTKALDHCRRSGTRLVVAKVDRLSRSAHFLLTILNSGVEVEFADLPQVSGPQGRFLLTSMAAVAELEAGLISERTKAALKQARARGKVLGNPRGAAALRRYEAEHGHVAATAGRIAAADQRAECWRGIFEGMVDRDLSLNAMAKELDEAGERTPRGSAWTAKAVSRMLARLDLQVSYTTPYMQAA